MKTLILGSEGFIGSHLAAYLRSNGHQVISADIVLKETEDYVVINAESPNFAQLFLNKTFDVCINASGAANVQFSFSSPYSDFFLNTSNVYAILEAIRLYNPQCAFLNLSSAAVYGNPTMLPVREDASLMPASPYGAHKMYSEQICKEFFDFFNVQTLSVRIFSAYGPGLTKQLFWDTYQKFKNSDKKVIELYGTGNETRDFIYIKDVVRAIDLLIKQRKFNGSAVNVASGVGVTIVEAIELFGSLINPQINFHFNQKIKIGDPLFWQADIDLIKTLGFEAKYTLKEGLKETVEWLKNKS